MIHTILGQTPDRSRSMYLAALVPAGVAVLILTANVQPSLDPQDAVANRNHQALARMSPIQSAEASIAEPESDLLERDDPVQAFVSDAEADESTAAAMSIRELPAEEADAARSDVSVQEQTLTVRRGDSLSALLGNAGVPPRDWLAVARMRGIASKLQRLHPGDVLQIGLDADGLSHLAYALDDMQTLVVERRSPGSFHQRVDVRAAESVRRHAVGTVDDSLYLSAMRMGLSDRMVMQLAEIFAWDIDFERDTRSGDLLTVIYEQPVDLETGDDIGRAKIIAAAYSKTKTTYEAVYFEDEAGTSGYFNADGRPMKKAFLRTPVEFSRISSRYSRSRKHPVLNTVRAHKGVDYAAPTGTPIRATGDGRIVHAGNKGGYGRTVIIEHAGKYQTLYAHMSRYGHAIGAGARVRQGQIIGYVGASGLATGPHLHYEFHVKGQHVDPLSVRLPAADPLPPAQLALFRSHAEPLLAELASLNPATKLALAD